MAEDDLCPVAILPGKNHLRGPTSADPTCRRKPQAREPGQAEAERHLVSDAVGRVHKSRVVISRLGLGTRRHSLRSANIADRWRIIEFKRLTMATTPTNMAINEALPPVRLISLSVRAGQVFANHAKALNWLQTPNPSLQGKTPIEAATTEEGFVEADEILTRIEHGVLG